MNLNLQRYALLALFAAGLFGASTQSRRRSTVNGSMTRPYSLCLKSPRRRSATDQMRDERACWFMRRGLLRRWVVLVPIKPTGHHRQRSEQDRREG